MKDTSIFQGIIEFSTANGRRIRAESIDPRCFQIRELVNGAWIYQGRVRINGEATPERIMYALGDDYE